jgi:hypothetical protein
LDGSVAAVEILMHVSRITPDHRHNWRKSDIVVLIAELVCVNALHWVSDLDMALTPSRESVSTTKFQRLVCRSKDQLINEALDAYESVIGAPGHLSFPPSTHPRGATPALIRPATRAVSA